MLIMETQGNNMSKHFPNATGSKDDLELLEFYYQTGKDFDARGLFEKAKPYYNSAMALILSKRVTLKKV